MAFIYRLPRTQSLSASFTSTCFYVNSLVIVRSAVAFSHAHKGKKGKHEETSNMTRQEHNKGPDRAVIR